MKLNSHSFLATFYRYFYVKAELPNNLCDYFWGLVVAFISLPFVWISLFINRMNKKIIYRTEHKSYYVYGSPFPTFLGLVFSLLMILVGIAINALITKIIGYNVQIPTQPFTTIFYLYLLGIASFVVSTIIYFIINGLNLLVNKLKIELTPQEKELIANKLHDKAVKRAIKKEHKSNTPNLFKLMWVYIKAFKEKNCPLISWDYEKTK